MTMVTAFQLQAEIRDLQARIAALRGARLPVVQEEAMLAAKQAELAALQPPEPVGEQAEYEDEVDLDSFESGGQFASPSQPCTVRGKFLKIITPSGKDKADQRWWVFETDDPRIMEEKGRQIQSAIVVSPKGSGAFKLKQLLDALGISYTATGGRVSYKIPRGLPCSLIYTTQTFKQKTEVRLDMAEAIGSSTPVV